MNVCKHIPCNSSSTSHQAYHRLSFLFFLCRHHTLTLAHIHHTHVSWLHTESVAHRCSWREQSEEIRKDYIDTNIYVRFLIESSVMTCHADLEYID